MFVGVKFVEFIGSDGRNYKKERFEIECEHCHAHFIVCKSEKNRKRRFCCREHADIEARAGGCVLQRKKETWMKKLGVSHPSKSEDIKKKKRETCIKNHGVSYPLQSQQILEASQKTLFDRFGVTSPLQSQEIKEKLTKTNLERYGVTNVFCSALVKEKSKKTSIEHFGFPVPSMSPIIKERIIKTNLERYGVEQVFSSSIIKEKIALTCLVRYGVKSTAAIPSVVISRNTLEARVKAHQTMKRMKTYRKSAVEDKCFKLLCEMFGVENVLRQELVNGWSIDFFVKPICTYVQLDGVYWHGLDRPLSKILEYKSPRDIVIYKKHLFDIKQSEWFKDNGLSLVRITDVEFLKQGINLLKERLQRHGNTK